MHSPTKATARASFSSAPDLTLDLTAADRLPALPSAYLDGRNLDLLAPLHFVAPNELPNLEPSSVDRAALATALEDSNVAYAHPHASFLAEQLASSETRVVVTGQQPGLFGGPLYTLSKMVAAVRWAERLEAEGVPAIAVFWVATEDHDFAEVSQASFLGRSAVERLDLGDDPQDLLPVGLRSFGEPVSAALDRLAALGGGDRHEAWVEELRALYRPDVRFGEAFSRLAVRMLGERCPLILDSMLYGVKQAQKPWLRKLVERRKELEQAYIDADESIEARGFPLQVAPQRGTSPLFFLSQAAQGGAERRRIEWGEDFETWSLRGEDKGGTSSARSDDSADTRTIDDLLFVIDHNPGAISPGVLARPAMQDAILGTTLQVLGPGEMSYMAQAAATYRVLDLQAPSTTLRPQVLVLESHHADHLSDHGLSLADALGPEDALAEAMADRVSLDRVEAARQKILDETDRLKSLLIEIDANLERPWEKTRGRIEQSVGVLVDKAVAASARSDEVAARRLDRLRRELLPDGKLQERLVSSAHYQRKYGDQFVEALFEQMTLDGSRLQAIRL